MNKKIISVIVAFLLFMTGVAPQASAYTVHELFDAQGVVDGSPYYDAASDSIILKVSARGSRAVYTSYTDSTFSTPAVTKTVYPSDYGWSYFQGLGFNCNVPYKGELYSETNVLLVRILITPSEIQNPACNSNPDGSIGGTDDKVCDACALFACPGWDEYMGKLDEIKAAIPPAPDWPVVADIFRDSITPKIKSDLIEVLGRAPEPPPAPPAPNVALPEEPEELGGLTDRGIEKPEGEEAPGLEDATFTPEDIKNEAPVIEEKEDPTDGFTIDDPIEKLPSQEEFMQNKPAEVEAPLPENPKEEENVAPVPTENTGAAPIPDDGGATAPTPDEGSNTAPLPSDGNNAAPVPSDGAIAPLPGDGGMLAPLPGE